MGSACPGTPASNKSKIGRPMSSNAETASPSRQRTWPSSSTPASGKSTPIHAVSLAVGLGNSLSTAAVMMPSVPSAPMNSCFRS